jgi:hypothetical protein
MNETIIEAISLVLRMTLDHKFLASISRLKELLLLSVSGKATNVEKVPKPDRGILGL